jgi:hypothetical protein
MSTNLISAAFATAPIYTGTVNATTVAAGEPQHLAWARTRPGGGRGFGFTGAHVHWNWAHPDLRRLVLNAIAWCAHAEVPEGGVDSAPLGLAELQAPLGTPPERFDPDRVRQMLDGLPKR